MSKDSPRVVVERGHKTMLIVQRESDFDTVLVGINDPEVRHFIGRIMPISEPAERQWFAGRGMRDTSLSLGIATLEGELIGGLGLDDINWINRTATGGAVIWNKDFWDDGHGTDAEMLGLQLAFLKLNLRAVAVAVYSYNQRSEAVIVKCGGRLVGKRERWLERGGQFYDEHLYTIHHEDWLPRWEYYKEHKTLKGFKP